MIWCLISPAVLCVILALAALMVQPRTIPLPRLRLTTLLRGCVASLFLLLALGLIGIALLTHT